MRRVLDCDWHPAVASPPAMQSFLFRTTVALLAANFVLTMFVGFFYAVPACAPSLAQLLLGITLVVIEALVSLLAVSYAAAQKDDTVRDIHLGAGTYAHMERVRDVARGCPWMSMHVHGSP